MPIPESWQSTLSPSDEPVHLSCKADTPAYDRILAGYCHVNKLQWKRLFRRRTSKGWHLLDHITDLRHSPWYCSRMRVSWQPSLFQQVCHTRRIYPYQISSTLFFIYFRMSSLLIHFVSTQQKQQTGIDHFRLDRRSCAVYFPELPPYGHAPYLSAECSRTHRYPFFQETYPTSFNNVEWR